ncbi:pyridoxal phosphate-dependent transferase [Pyronema domesticum]|nr:pyridoxal phosphate-dependent transferase [Pyronema domesticum]
MATQNHNVSNRVRENIAEAAGLAKLWAVLANLYHAEKNPTGIVNLGIAENALMYPELLDKLNKIPVEAADLPYGANPAGSQTLRTALANFMTKNFASLHPVKPEHIVVSSGLTSIAEMLAWTLCDEGDGILLGRPFYSAFPNDFYARSKVLTVPVSFGDVDQFSEDCVECYEKAIVDWNKQQEEQGKKGRIRAMMVVNPHNPLGRCYPPETLKAIMALCQKHQIHLLSDEIYALSLYTNPSASDAPGFTSILSLSTSGLIDPSLVHVLYGMSKDFGANGFRLGAFVSQNNIEVLQGMSATANFAWPSSMADKAWAAILNDEEFLGAFIETNKKRLGEQYMRCTQILREHGIQFWDQGNAALFLWLDLRDYLPSDMTPLEGEKWLSQKLIDEGGVFISRSETFYGEHPGWFRIVFSLPDAEEGMRRLVKTLDLQPLKN